jgi:hypothetical protein
MLSPNERNFVKRSSGGLVTVTAKLHELFCVRASLAVHVTVVEPTANAEPLDGVHVVVTGAVPPLTVGENVMATGSPVADTAV